MRLSLVRLCSRRLFAALTLAIAACAGGPTSSDLPLPPEFAVRSDVPYIRGPIVERTLGASGEIRLLVRASSDDARVSEALVTVLPNAIIRWADGTHGTTDDLRRGRAVMVWVAGPELRSAPPQVGGNGFILYRLP